jgi:hypothetical protein
MNNTSHGCWQCQHLKVAPEPARTVGSANTEKAGDIHVGPGRD